MVSDEGQGVNTWESFLKLFQGYQAAVLCNFLGRVGKGQGAPQEEGKEDRARGCF